MHVFSPFDFASSLVEKYLTSIDVDVFYPQSPLEVQKKHFYEGQTLYISGA